MTIHHDKMAYGRLARTSEEISEDKLAEMLKKLNSEADGEADAHEEPAGKDSKQK